MRALAWSGRGIAAADYRVDDGPWRPMAPAGRPALWTGADPAPQGTCRLTVRATDAAGETGEDLIELAPFAAPRRAPTAATRIPSARGRSGTCSGTRLGPNRNGRPW